MQQFRDGVAYFPPVPLLQPPSLPPALDELPEMAWCASADGSDCAFNARWQAVTGMAATGTDWTQVVDADDRAAVQARWRASLANRQPFEASFRLRHADGGTGWVLARAMLVKGDGTVLQHWLGTATDIDALKAGEEQARLVANELAHRIGNIFGVVGSVMSLSAREHPEAANFARSAGARLEALAQAHSYIWPLSAEGAVSQQRLQGLIRQLVLPYQAVGGPLVEVTGDDMDIDGPMINCVALVMHELATNGVKYGALSQVQGCLAIRVRRTARHLTIIWSETGGPSIARSPTRQGFGTTLIDRVMKMGHGARTRRWWRPGGLAVVMRFNLAAD